MADNQTKAELRAELEAIEAGRWAPLLDGLDEAQKAPLLEFALVKPDGRTPWVTDYSREGGRLKTKISLEALQKLLALDKTKDHAWTRWLLLQAGGGEAAVAMTKRTAEMARNRFLDLNKAKFRNDPEGLNAEWEKQKAHLSLILISGDEDVMKKAAGTFGFAYSFPGEGQRYDNTSRSVSRFMAVYKQGLRMNKELVQRGETPLPMEPDTIKSLQEMDTVAAKIHRYYAAEKARTDVRVGEWPDPSNQLWKAEEPEERKTWKKKAETWQKRKTVYDDDYVTVVVPLTYAAAVEYGSDAWDVSNTAAFRNALSTSTGEDAWSRLNGVVAFFTFNVPLPAYVRRDDAEFGLGSMQRLMMVAPRHDDPVFHDTDNNKYTSDQIREMIRSEVDRSPDEQDPEFQDVPIERGANVYKTKEEAEEVVRHFDAALHALATWMDKNATRAGFVPKPFAQQA